MANCKKIQIGNTKYDLIDSRIPGIDSSPSSGSDNVVKSGGVYTALAEKADIDSTYRTLAYNDGINYISGTTDGMTYALGTGNAGGEEDYTLATTGDISTAVSGLEDSTNKVTSISSSSTDTQYPSAKCVYDIVGDIETLINAL